MSGAELAELVGGAAIALCGLVDLFLTIFNYDGFTFVAGRYQRMLWSALRAGSRMLPTRMRQAFLSLASASMLPATLALWLGMEVVGFGLLYGAGLSAHAFSLARGTGSGVGAGMYLSAGDITTLTFGDVVAHRALWRALADLEAMVGLATFTLGLGYVVTTFSVLGKLDALHNTVRLHAQDPGRPSSILARHYRGGAPDELTDLLQLLSQSLESYDEGLRRYPVVYYFHTRRVERSVPRVFWVLGELLALLRWGLPLEEPVSDDPWLAALLEQYATTVRRLQRSFVGPHPLPAVQPVGRERFTTDYLRQDDAEPSVAGFVSTQARARAAAGLPSPPDADLEAAYERYLGWREFLHLRDIVLARITDRLGYELADVATGHWPLASDGLARQHAAVAGTGGGSCPR